LAMSTNAAVCFRRPPSRQWLRRSAAGIVSRFCNGPFNPTGHRAYKTAVTKFVLPSLVKSTLPKVATVDLHAKGPIRSAKGSHPAADGSTHQAAPLWLCLMGPILSAKKI
jgi:hypothetical protein